jgi:hypothetical protein
MMPYLSTIYFPHVTTIFNHYVSHHDDLLSCEKKTVALKWATHELVWDGFEYVDFDPGIVKSPHFRRNAFMIIKESYRKLHRENSLNGPSEEIFIDYNGGISLL